MDGALVSAGSHRYSPQRIPKLLHTVLPDSFWVVFGRNLGLLLGWNLIKRKVCQPCNMGISSFSFFLLLRDLWNVMRQLREFYARFTFPTCANLTSCVLMLFLERLFFPLFTLIWVPQFSHSQRDHRYPNSARPVQHEGWIVSSALLALPNGFWPLGNSSIL